MGLVWSKSPAPQAHPLLYWPFHRENSGPALSQDLSLPRAWSRRALSQTDEWWWSPLTLLLSERASFHSPETQPWSHLDWRQSTITPDWVLSHTYGPLRVTPGRIGHIPPRSTSALINNRIIDEVVYPTGSNWAHAHLAWPIWAMLGPLGSSVPFPTGPALIHSLAHSALAGLAGPSLAVQASTGPPASSGPLRPSLANSAMVGMARPPLAQAGPSLATQASTGHVGLHWPRQPPLATQASTGHAGLHWPRRPPLATQASRCRGPPPTHLDTPGFLLPAPAAAVAFLGPLWHYLSSATLPVQPLGRVLPPGPLCIPILVLTATYPRSYRDATLKYLLLYLH